MRANDPRGKIGISLCHRGVDSGEDVAAAPPLPARPRSPERILKAELRYYLSAIHRATFMLPEFARRKLLATEAL